MACSPLSRWLISATAIVTICWPSSSLAIILNIPDILTQNVTGTASWTQENPLHTGLIVKFTFSLPSHDSSAQQEDSIADQSGFTANLSELEGSFTYRFKQPGLYSVTATIQSPTHGSVPFTAENGNLVEVRSAPTTEVQGSASVTSGSNITIVSPSPSSSLVPTPVSTVPTNMYHKPHIHLKLVLVAVLVPIITLLLVSTGLIFYRRRRQRRNMQRKKSAILDPPSASSAHLHPNIESGLVVETLDQTAENRKQDMLDINDSDIEDPPHDLTSASVRTSLTERQQELVTQADTIRSHLVAFEESLSDPSLSEDQIRGGLDEIERLRGVMEGILRLRESDWARGVIDDPPPAYEDLRRWDSGRAI